MLGRSAARAVDRCFCLRRSLRAPLPPARSVPVPASDVIADEDAQKLQRMKECFAMADQDGCVRAAVVARGIVDVCAHGATFPRVRFRACVVLTLKTVSLSPPCAGATSKHALLPPTASSPNLANSNGAIDKAELRALLETVENGWVALVPWEGSFPDEKLDAVFEKYDKDASGAYPVG
jgi:hypothetical protein